MGFAWVKAKCPWKANTDVKMKKSCLLLFLHWVYLRLSHSSLFWPVCLSALGYSCFDGQHGRGLAYLIPRWEVWHGMEAGWRKRDTSIIDWQFSLLWICIRTFLGCVCVCVCMCMCSISCRNSVTCLSFSSIFSVLFWKRCFEVCILVFCVHCLFRAINKSYLF